MVGLPATPAFLSYLQLQGFPAAVAERRRQGLSAQPDCVLAWTGRSRSHTFGEGPSSRLGFLARKLGVTMPAFQRFGQDAGAQHV